MLFLGRAGTREARKAQTSVEYLMLVGGALLLIVIIYVLLNSNVFGSSETKIVTQGDEIQGLIASLKPTEEGGAGGGTGDTGGTDEGVKIPDSPFEPVN